MDDRLDEDAGAMPDLNDAAFVQQVRTALPRVEAPAGFTERLMARAEIQGGTLARPQKVRTTRRGVLLQMARPVWRVAYAAAALLAMTAGAVHVQHVRAERHRADQAAAQLDIALQVTNHALDHVSAKLETTEFGKVQRALENEGDR